METFSTLLALCAGKSPVPVNSQHKGQWRGALIFSLICAWINYWVNNCQAGDLRRLCGHYDVNVTSYWSMLQRDHLSISLYLLRLMSCGLFGWKRGQFTCTPGFNVLKNMHIHYCSEIHWVFHLYIFIVIILLSIFAIQNAMFCNYCGKCKKYVVHCHLWSPFY